MGPIPAPHSWDQPLDHAETTGLGNPESSVLEGALVPGSLPLPSFGDEVLAWAVDTTYCSGAFTREAGSDEQWGTGSSRHPQRHFWDQTLLNSAGGHGGRLHAVTMSRYHIYSILRTREKNLESQNRVRGQLWGRGLL